jgi:uncharacterized SAM-binding protein YcdF (DUF218 family)
MSESRFREPGIDPDSTNMLESGKVDGVVDAKIRGDYEPSETGDMADLVELTTPEKQEQIRAIATNGFGDGATPDVVFSMSGGIAEKPNKKGVYGSTAFTQKTDTGHVTGSKPRIIATTEIANVYPEIPIVATSKVFDDEPTHASVIAEELISRGVDSNRIVYEEKSISTLTEVIEMVKLAVEKNWQHLAVITNSYHIPRMREMYQRLPEIVDDQLVQEAYRYFQEKGGEVSFIAAEDVMRVMSKRFENYLDRVAELPEYQRTVASEAKGLEDIRAGRYRVNKPIVHHD